MYLVEGDNISASDISQAQFESLQQQNEVLNVVDSSPGKVQVIIRTL
jgi:hypothetical protein